MKVDQKQGGYTLLLTLVLLILFAALGFSLITLTSSGIIKNTKRQEIIQSTALSEMGIDRITKEINHELTESLGLIGLRRPDFIDRLENTLDKYLCSVLNSNNPTAGTTGEYKVCIKGYVNTEDKNGVNPLRKLVTFTSKGESGSTERTLTSKIEIGAAFVPDILNYAIGANDNNNGIAEPGEGNLLLHGGVSITGDIKVDGNLLTYENGYMSGSWKSSSLPEVFSTDPKRTPSIVLGKKSFYLNSTSKLNYENHKNVINFPESTNYKEKSLNQLFGVGRAPVKVNRKPVQTSIGIESYQDEYKYTRAQSTKPINVGESMTINNKQNENTTSKVFPYYDYTNKECDKNGNNCKVVSYKGEKGTYLLSGTNTFDKFSTAGDLQLNLNSNTVVKNGMYVEGDLLIGDPSSSSNSPSTYKDVTLEGVIFVNGSVKIRGANLKGNVVLYTTGDVDIQYSTITGKKLTDKTTGSLIIFAKDSVVIKNISANQTTPSKIKGFFYSEKELEMYGVISNMIIEGGLSGRSVVLNAVRTNGVPRLQIIYDHDIIENYTDLQREPIITEIDVPLEKDRSF